MVVLAEMVYPSAMSLTTQKLELDLSPDAFGELRASMDIVDDGAALRDRMREDGYLYLPGYLDRAEVLDTRAALLDRLAVSGCLEPGTPVAAAIARKDHGSYFMPELAHDNPTLMRLLYDGLMMAFYTRLLGGEVRHFDFTWMRAVTPGQGTAPHCDIVYMGRGTTNLYTAWTPLGDIPRAIGGLLILEGSHTHDRLRLGYGAKDVDAYCTNQNGIRTTGSSGFGALTFNPVRLRERLGGRWLTADFRAGDLLTFSMFTVHCSLDNGSDQVRLSSDTRYQLASEPADERWVGEHPIGHGDKARREKIC
jgi:ectoine hydroxylase-related dioxygenase (phytanoyl-CoA dioxygenase family)